MDDRNITKGITPSDPSHAKHDVHRDGENENNPESTDDEDKEEKDDEEILPEGDVKEKRTGQDIPKEPTR